MIEAFLRKSRIYINAQKNNSFLFLLSFILLLPNGTLFYLNTPSTAYGLGVSLFLLLIVYFYNKKFILKKIFSKRFIFFILTISLAIIIHTGIVLQLLDGLNLLRLTVSALGLLFVFICSYLFVNYITLVKQNIINSAIYILFYFMLLIGILSIYFISNHIVRSKSMLLFSEPSHYALIFAPLMLYIFYTSESVLIKIVYFLIILAMIVFIKNMTLFTAVLLTALCLFNIKKLLAAASLFFLSLFLINPNNINDYIFNRVNFWHYTANSESLSMLVYFSAIERAYLSLINTFGIGVGLNQFGIVGENGHYMEKVIEYASFPLCLNDGSFLASKFIAELGIVALLLIFVYLYYFVKIILEFQNKQYINIQDILFASFYISFSLSLFIRGMGYFTPSVFMFITSSIWFYRRYFPIIKVNSK